MRHPYRKKSISWIWVILAFIIFWPIGFLLLFIKLSSDRSAVVRTKPTGKILSAVVWVLLAMAGISLLGAVVREIGIMGVVVLFIIGGILLNRTAKRTKNKGERYKKYIDLVVNQSQTFIDNIAIRSGVSFEETAHDLQDMINAGYFHDATIDPVKRTIVLPKPAEPPKPAKTKVIACDSCGAKVRVTIDTEADCDYCGTALQ